MIQPKSFDEVARRVASLLPPGIERLHADVQENLKSLVAAALERMDLVTRDEFDVQAAVLARTREKVTRLEATVARLEAALDAAPPPSGQPASMRTD